jgi:hypothetical protein
LYSAFLTFGLKIASPALFFERCIAQQKDAPVSLTVLELCLSKVKMPLQAQG